MINEKYKKVVKIFTIIGMVTRFWLIVPIIVGIIVLKEINKQYMTRDNKVVSGILSLFLCSSIAGIFLLIDVDAKPAEKEYQPQKQQIQE
ncbi:hypothetical protein [Metamycoplasma alkalescens]|uniref:Uncharacterized protein n=2 Tax=Metamycoplasma alkalescens TaxID=45363 RepID=A0A318UBT5_9BACT|nr:hypothetical protein [Metamycoplasma alkalescens]PYF42552.1 hypothetical protein BCF88_1107 [Metamycoplasma alkalescens]